MIPQHIFNQIPAILPSSDVQVPMVCIRKDIAPGQAPNFAYDITRLYEDGSLICFENAQLNIFTDEWRLLNGLNLSAQSDKFVKKAKLKHLFQPLTDKTTYDNHIFSKMTPDFEKAQQLQGMMMRVTQQVLDYVKAWFPTYKVLDDRSITWRLTPTDSEAMHYDSYGVDPNDYHNVRVFINLDDRPRVWGLSHDITTTIAQHRELLRPHAGLHPNLFNAKVNKLLPWATMPRHFVNFAPLNMWLVNSQRVAHEIIYGRRMLAATIACDPASMRDPSKHFVNVVKKAWEANA